MRRWTHGCARWLFPMAVGAAITVGVFSYLGDKDVRHGVVPVEPGVLFRSGQLEPEQLAQEIRRRGIKTVVNLGSKIDTDREVCQAEGIRYLELPVGDCWNLCGCAAPGSDQRPETPFDLTPLWEVLDDPDARPVLIHCWGGIHRTGVVAALYRIERQGWLAEDAIRELDLYGFESHKPKYAEVVRYLRNREAASTARMRAVERR